jgi:hypothetical protein
LSRCRFAPAIKLPGHAPAGRPVRCFPIARNRTDSRRKRSMSLWVGAQSGHRCNIVFLTLSNPRAARKAWHEHYS